MPGPSATKAMWISYAKKLGKYTEALEKKVSDGAKDGDEDSGSESDDDGVALTEAEKKAVKLTEPLEKFSGKREEYRAWKRAIRRWYRLRKPLASGKTLGALLIGSLSGEAYAYVTSVVKAKHETFEKVTEVLDVEYGEDELERAIRATQAMDSFKRSSGETIDDYLKRYVQLRARAMEEGWTPSKKTEGSSLLGRAELGEGANLALLQQLEAKGLGPTYAAVRAELKTLSTAQKIPKAMGTTAPTKRAGDAALVGEVKRLKSDVQQLKNAPTLVAAQGTEKCRYFAREGKCQYGDNCRFEHVAGGGGAGGGSGGGDGGKGKDKDGKGGKGKFGKGKGKGGKGGKGKDGKGKGGASARPGDWLCPKCADLQFAGNDACRLCSTPKPPIPGPPGKPKP